MAKNHNLKLIKSRRAYTYMKIAQIFKIHQRTVQKWHRQGLKVIDEEKRPFLVMGEEVCRFLKENAEKRRKTLKTGEFFCFKCRCARRSLPGNMSIETTPKQLGKDSKQVFIRGICEVCGQSLLLFFSEKRLDELKDSGLLFSIDTKALSCGASKSETGIFTEDEKGLYGS